MFSKIKEKFQNSKVKKVVLGCLGGSVIALDSAVSAFATEPTLTTALNDGTSILNAGYDFIASHAILFSICAFGIIVGAVKVIRRMI